MYAKEKCSVIDMFKCVVFCTGRDVLKGIEYNSSMSINCESEKWDTEVEKDKKVSFDNVTNAE